MVFDPTYYLVINISSIPTHDRMDFYGNVEEAIPSSAPTPYGKDIVTCCFVDADHAVDKLSPEDLAPASLFLWMEHRLVWYSKRQGTTQKLRPRLSVTYATSYEC